MRIRLNSNSPNFFALTGKIDPLSEIRNAGFVTTGDVYWVKDTSDADYLEFKDAVGQEYIANDIQAGIDKTTADQNDYVFVVPKDDGSPWDITSSVDINKDRVHVIGVGYGPHPNSYANTIRGFAAAASDDQLVEVTGHGVEFAGFRLLGTAGTSDAGTTDNALIYIGTGSAGTAHDFYMHDCALEANYTDDAAPVNMIASPGTVHAAYFENIEVTYLSAGTMIPVALPHGGKRWEFRNSRFVLDAQATSDRFVSAGTGAVEYALFDNCQFINVEQGTLVASAVVGSTTADNAVLLNNCSAVNVTQFGTDPAVFVAPAASGTLDTVYAPGLSVGTAAVSAA